MGTQASKAQASDFEIYGIQAPRKRALAFRSLLGAAAFAFALLANGCMGGRKKSPPLLSKPVVMDLRQEVLDQMARARAVFEAGSR